ncbi:hypothetical protein K474DRAFT_1630464 [Panus rudis PR-1116 ss-1]|nr:hypothetical protein K474DRAFT_1630464 [Panus rudis PR-1116 ss-1]
MEFSLNKQPSSSGTSTPVSNAERDEQLLSIGQQCSADLCHLVDFLPFKCQHCGMSYCGEHFLPQAHKCEKYDETKHNRVAPSCPLCNTPVAIPPGQDPNIRMERHFNTECVVMLGDAAKKSSTPRCPKPKCGKLLYKMASFSCEKCHQQFCPSHRYPDQHACKGLATTAMNNASASARKPNTSASTTSQPKSQPVPSAASSSSKASSSGNAQKPSSSRTNPFSATDRSSTFPPNDITTSDDTNANYSNHTNNSNAATDNTNADHNPPQRCSPKQPSGSTSSFLDTLSFVPRPVFATA